MKKEGVLLIVVMLVAGIAAESSAGLINYEMKQKRQETKRNLRRAGAPAPTTTQVATATPVRRTTPEARPTLNATESKYDKNSNGILEPAELKDFYNDVIAGVRRDRTYRIDSNLLGQFDANNDGEISRYEVRNIEKAVR